MKNTIRILGIIALVAIIGFSVMGCGGSNPFTGTWSGKNVDYRSLELTFAPDNTLVFDLDGRKQSDFTYTYKGSIATIFNTYGKEVCTATITSNNTITTVIEKMDPFTLIKTKSENQLTKPSSNKVDKSLNGTWVGEELIFTFNNGKLELLSKEGNTLETFTYTGSNGKLSLMKLDDNDIEDVNYSIKGKTLSIELDGETIVLTRK